jgi:glutathione S-transferase
VSAPYRIFGAELSPYSVKVRSYFRYKGIPHEWIVRDMARMPEFQKYARLPLIPLVVTPEDEGIQDSTPIIEMLEARFPEPSIHPEDPALAFLSALLEEYADEWVNKPMFHYRWTYAPDREASAERIARMNLPDGDDDAIAKLAAGVRDRMVPRLAFVGSSEATRDRIEASYRRLLTTLEAHLARRSFLFGARPSFGDFGLAAQLYQCWMDPTPGAWMRKESPRVAAWVERMLDPRAEGDFEAREGLLPTLRPLLEREVAGLFLPWSTANAEALARGEAEFSVELEGSAFSQATQKYHAKSLQALKTRYAGVADRGALDPILEEVGCLAWLRAT